MKERVVFRIYPDETKISAEYQNSIKMFRQELEPFIKIKRNLTYEMYKQEELFDELIKFDQKDIYHEFLSILEEEVIFDKTELKNIVGYIMHPKRMTYVQYMDASIPSLPYKVCRECFNLVEQECCYMIPPSSTLRRWNKTKCVFGYDDMYETPFVSLPMYEYLLEHRVQKDCFNKVVSKKGKILAYQLVGNTKLEQGVYESELYRNFGKCPVCGHPIIEKNIEEYRYCKKYIDMEKVNAWSDVNYTAENYPFMHTVIISPRIHDLIKDVDCKIDFEPVFCKI